MRENSKIIVSLLLSLLVFSVSSIVPCTPSATNHIVGTDASDPHICTCESNYLFKPSTHACVRNCQLITHALPNCKQTQTNLDNCDCQTGYEWNQANYVCGKICTGVPNTNGNYDPANIEQCACTDATYEWDAAKGQCVKICTPLDETHKDGLDTTDTTYTTCKCKSGYIYDKVNDLCIVPCNNDPHAQLKAGSTTFNECQCLPGYENHTYTGDTIGKCGLVCANDAATTGKDETNNLVCTCNTGYTWPDPTTNPTQAPFTSCILNCRSTTNLANSPFGNTAADACACNTDFQFVIASGATPVYPGVCARTCTGLPHATGANDAADPSKCACDAGYSWEYQNKYPGKCTRECDTAANTDTTNNGGWTTFEECSCPSGFIWDATQSPPVCVRDCTATVDNIKSAGTLKTGSTTECNCVTGYKFETLATSPYVNKCVLDCSLLSQPYTLANDGILSCSCADGFQFVDSTVGCGRKCGPTSTLLNSVARDTDTTKCACDAGYTWSTEATANNECAIDCVGDYTAANHVSRSECQCTDTTLYQWLPFQNKCGRKCAGVANSNQQTDPANLNACQCNAGYVWNAPTTTPYESGYDNMCIKDCSATADANSAGTHTDANTCVCNLNFIWETSTTSGFQSKCVRECSAVDNSKRDYVHTAVDLDKCDCLAGYVWTPASNECKNPCGTAAVAQSIGTACFDPLACECAATYHWQASSFSCITCDAANPVWDQATQSCKPNPVCGDSSVGTGETCDDGNNASGDGCSSTCQTETGYTCTAPIGSASVCNLDAYTCGASSALTQLKLYYIKYGSNYLDQANANTPTTPIGDALTNADTQKWWVFKSGTDYQIQSKSCKFLDINTGSIFVNPTPSASTQAWAISPAPSATTPSTISNTQSPLYLYMLLNASTNQYDVKSDASSTGYDQWNFQPVP